MPDTPKKNDISGMPEISEDHDLPYLGCLEITTVRGKIHVCEVPGYITTTVSVAGDETIGVILYSPPENGESHGVGSIVQLRPDFARNMAASLLRMANKIDPKGMN